MMDIKMLEIIALIGLGFGSMIFAYKQDAIRDEDAVVSAAIENVLFKIGGAFMAFAGIMMLAGHGIH